MQGRKLFVIKPGVSAVLQQVQQRDAALFSIILPWRGLNGVISARKVLVIDRFETSVDLTYTKTHLLT